MDDTSIASKQPQLDDALVEKLLKHQESGWFDVKRVSGGKLTRALESIVAFANTEGGYLALGLEDESKATGRARVYGIQENPEAVDELHRLIGTRITPPLEKPEFREIGCTLRDGSRGSVILVHVEKSARVHSIVSDGTWSRLSITNKELVAEEITRLSLDRGTTSAESRLADVSFDLLKTPLWDTYAASRRLTRPIAEAMEHLGLARRRPGRDLLPTWAGVLLFAEQPGGLLGAKASIRVFHYKGEAIRYAAAPNLLKKPQSFSGPLILQIQGALEYILAELASGVQMGPLGLEIIHKYPVRVIREAITNAVIHRDYSVNADVQVNIYSDHIAIVSPGVFPGKVTVRNIRAIGSFNRNPLIVANLREFPEPPNLDAGEGVRMMYQTMESAGLYPPLYRSRSETERDEVVVILFNENRPTVWDQVSKYLSKHGAIGNAEVRRIMGTENTLAASKAIRGWVDRKLLVVANPNAGTRVRKYMLSGEEPMQPLFSS